MKASYPIICSVILSGHSLSSSRLVLRSLGERGMRGSNNKDMSSEGSLGILRYAQSDKPVVERGNQNEK